MVRGYPDWQGVSKKVEATIRQNIIFPTGRVIFSDEFSTPSVTWRSVFAGAGTQEIVTINSFTPPGCVRLLTAATAGNYEGMYYEAGLPRSFKLGVEAAFCFADAVDTYLNIIVYWGKGNETYSGKVRYSRTNKYWEYVNSVNVWTRLPGSDMNLQVWVNNYHRVKVIMDFSLKKYVSLQIDSYFIDMSDLNLRTITFPVNEGYYIELRAETQANAAKTVYIDNLIITEEE